MVMAEYFTYDRLQELWQQIHHLHLTYLDTEDSPQKLDQRSKLEERIRDYLCIAPHIRKFYCPETAEVLHRSASSRKDFSGYRAALAWNAVSMYAGNLLSQPWRKEYRTIKTYCGFYKHQIEANLVGAEAMFEAMGYKHAGDGILILEDPVCPDRIANVSQDSIVAFVECQILKTIWEEISNNFKISWLDVLEFRESHICSPEQSIRMLNFQLHERRYQQEQQQHHQHRSYPSADTYSTLPRYNVPPQTIHMPQQQQHPVSYHTPALTGMHSFPPHLSHYAPMPSNHVQPSVPCPGQCVYGTNTYYNNYGTYGPVPQNSYPRYGTVPYHPVPCVTTKPPCNGYCYPNTNGCIAPSPYMCPVPTAQLIELDNAAQNGMYDVTDSAAKRQQDQLESHKQLAKSTNLDSLTLSKSKEDGAGTFESWDYVYRNLESQGYNKDLGERPNILQSANDSKKRRADAKKSKSSIELEDEFNTLNLNQSQSETQHVAKINDTLKKYNHEVSRRTKVDENSRVVPSSSYDNIIAQDTPQTKQQPQPQLAPTNRSISNGVTKTTSKTLPRTNLIFTEKTNHVTTTLDTKKLRKQDVDKVKPKESKTKETSSSSNGWNCNACTYLNNATIDICVMCGKSKKTVDITMAVGGSQCPRCTLVNPKEVSVCQACDASLANSPTYI